jgi:hypothetical protein
MLRYPLNCQQIFRLRLRIELMWVSLTALSMLAFPLGARAEEPSEQDEGRASVLLQGDKAGLEVCLPAQCTDVEKNAARLFVQQFRRRSDCPIRIAEAGAPADPAVRVRILLGDRRRQREIAELEQSGRITLPDRIEAEGYAIRTCAGDPRVIVLASSDPQGNLFGVGRLLRTFRFGEKGVTLPWLDAVESPQHTFRAEFLATHMQDNGYKDWILDQWRAYVAEMAIWGVNQIWYLPMQFGQTNNVFLGKGTAEQQRRWEVYRQVPDVVRELGLSVGIYIGVNDIFADEMIPGIEAAPGMAIEQNHVCPSHPGLR